MKIYNRTRKVKSLNSERPLDTRISGILKLAAFRKQMNEKLSYELIEKVWNKGVLNEVIEWKENFKLEGYFTNSKFEENTISYGKYLYAKENVDKFLVLDWVKFIGVSGSVAAENAKQADDIDLFIIVKNYYGWLYRIVIKIRSLFHGKLRRYKEFYSPDKFCDNFICEERGIDLLKNDIFVFHELSYLKSIYNESYLRSNLEGINWFEEYGVEVTDKHNEIQPNNANVFIKILNSLLFYLQVVGMIILKHKPNISRIQRNYKQGKIIFYPGNFREKVLQNYEEELKILLSKIN